jgi:hypothetical protein
VPLLAQLLCSAFQQSDIKQRAIPTNANESIAEKADEKPSWLRVVHLIKSID